MIKKSFLLSFCLYTSTLLSMHTPQALETFCKKHLKKQYILSKEENDVPDLIEMTIPDYSSIDRDSAASTFEKFCRNHQINVESYKQHLAKKESPRLEKEKYSLVDGCILRWRDHIIRRTIEEIQLKKEAIEDIPNIPNHLAGPYKKMILKQQKMAEIPQIVAAGHRYTELLRKQYVDHPNTYVEIYHDDKETEELYWVVVCGSALISDE